MTLRNMLVICSCAMLMSPSSVRAVDEQMCDTQESRSEAPIREEDLQQQESVFDYLYRISDEDTRNKLMEFQSDLDGLMQQLQGVCDELNVKHADIIEHIKDNMDLNSVPMAFWAEFTGQASEEDTAKHQDISDAQGAMHDDAAIAMTE